MNPYEERLSQLTPILMELKPERIYVYGSWIRGKAESDSDIDLVVVVSPDANILQLKRHLAASLYDAVYPYDLEPDVRIISRNVFNDRITKGDPFLTNVIKGKMLYGSTPH